jgi:hypothetical protein
MPSISRVCTSLTALVSLAMLAGAHAQTPTPPKPPKPPVKPVSTLKPIAAPATGALLVICKDFTSGQMPGALPYTDSRITYETIVVRDTSGATRTIYAPTHIIITHEFKPASASIGADGRGLASGECGTPNAVINGMTGPATLQFNNFPSVFVQVSKKLANSTSATAAVNLPACKSGLRSFRTVRQNANEFLVPDSASAACLN